MSLSWSSQRLRVHVAPGQVHVARIAGRLRKRVLETARLDCARDAEAALSALDAWLGEHTAAPLELVLSAHFARLYLLPWQEQLQDNACRLLLAQGLLEHRFAPERAADYRFALSRPRFAKAQCVLAVPVALIHQAEAISARRKIPLRQLCALASEAWDQFARRLPPRPGTLVVAEGDRLTRLHHDGQCLTGIDVLPQTLAGALTPDAAVFAPGQPDWEARAATALRLDAFPAIDSAFAGALCGAV